MSAVIHTVKQLPPRIQSLLSDIQHETDFVCAIKTAYKPNATIPILWLVLNRADLMLCNTHRTRGLSARHNWNEINLIRKLHENTYSSSIEIIFNSLDKDSIILPLPQTVTSSEVDSLISSFLKLKGA